MDTINVEVAYATIKLQKIIPIQVARDISVIDAIYYSKITDYFTELDSILKSPDLVVGIYGKKINPHSYHLSNHDRIEIYRPLAKTPNQKRLERAKNHEK